MTTDDSEIWLPAVGFEGFLEVSNMGQVRGVDSFRSAARAGRQYQMFRPGKLMPQYTHSTGYLIVIFVIAKKRRQVYVHRLVAMAFVLGDVGLSVNHVDGHKTHNKASNLEWISLADNTRKQWADGLADARGEKNGQHKLTAEKVLAIRRASEAGATNTDLAIIAGLSQSNVSFIVNSKRWVHLAEATSAHDDP